MAGYVSRRGRGVTFLIKLFWVILSSLQFSLVTQLCLSLQLHGLEHQASLSITNSRSLFKLMSMKSVIRSKHLILCGPLLLLPSILPSISLFQWVSSSASGGQSIGASVSASVLPMNIQEWLPLGWTGLICLQSKGLSRVFSNTTVQKHQFFGTQLSSWPNSHIHTWPLERPQLWLGSH